MPFILDTLLDHTPDKSELDLYQIATYMRFPSYKPIWKIARNDPKLTLNH